MRPRVVLSAVLLLVGASVALLPAAALAAGIDVVVRRDPERDLGGYSTYRWDLAERPEGHPLAPGSPLDEVIRATADRELAAKGLQLDDGAPDLLVRYDGALEIVYEFEGVYRDLGPLTWVGVPGNEVAESYRRGTLIISLVDAASGDVVWQAVGSRVGRTTDPTDVRRRAPRVVRRILFELPEMGAAR